MARWQTVRFDFHAMGGPCSLQLDGQDERGLGRVARLAIAEVRRIEIKYSRYQATSVLSRINACAGAAPVPVDDETRDLLMFADSLWQLSDGLFDITSGVLRRAWDFRQARLPAPQQVAALLPLVGWSAVERQGNHVHLPRAGMELDFGGFGKEYAADRAAAVLLQHGVQHALVNLGGDLHAVGPRGLPECAGAPWAVQIRHPRPPQDDPEHPLATLHLSRGGLATSGDYERFFIYDGQRYCHVLDPRTGWPVRQVQSVSTLASHTCAAGALCTVAMLKGTQALDWLNQQGARYLLVDQHGTVHHEANPAPIPTSASRLPNPPSSPPKGVLS